MPQIDFWHEFASTYSYLAAMRIEPLARERGLSVRWRPFLLGPIFKAKGWDTSPFLIDPGKGQYMLRDLARLTEHYGLAPFVLPASFPGRAVLASRVSLALGDAERPAFTRAVYHAEYAEGADIGETDVIAAALRGQGHDAEAVFTRANSDEVKEKLRSETAEAQRLGIFGAPVIVTADGELFWGNDRLDMALDWAARA
jgi:2-hydroxychromene-2-carboxylate isomerase